MPLELPVLEGPTAYVFPGQGAHHVKMLEPFRQAPRFMEHYQQVCGLLGGDPMVLAERDPAILNRNAVSSLLTVLASVAGLDLIREQEPSLQVAAVAGYSVGQWTALYASGTLTVEDLFDAVSKRAAMMDQCVAAAAPSGMLAVIGLQIAALEEVCKEAAGRGEFLQISNYNAPGQYTLAGSVSGLCFAEERLALMRPKRLMRVAVAGAWHSAMVAGAVEPLHGFLANLSLRPSVVPVIDNITGNWLPSEDGNRRTSLARQVAQPVLWMQGVRTMADFGIRNLIEIGNGDMLTTFGFFIDRSLRQHALVPQRRALS